MSLKVNVKPSEEIVKAALAEVNITDANGLVITLKKPGVLAQFRIVEALGDVARNAVYTGMVMPLIYVSAIDGDTVDFPINKREIEALIQRLDNEGVEAVMNGVQEHFGKRDDKEEKEAVKK